MTGLLSATTTSSGGGASVLFLVFVVFYVVTCLGTWGAYKKAGPYGTPAWSAFVPI